MPIQDTQEFIIELEKQGELKRVKAEVDPDLEIAEILNSQKAESSLNEVLSYLNNLKMKRPEVSHLIDNGLELFI